MSCHTSYDTALVKVTPEYFPSLMGWHVAAAQIAGHFSEAKPYIGITTVYRRFGRLAWFFTAGTRIV